MNQVIEQSFSYNQIPCLTFRPVSAGEVPLRTILFYHGWGGSIDSYRFFATLLAGWGYQVVLPELPSHGVRGGLDNYFTREAYDTLWDVIVGAVSEAKGIYEELVRQGSADPAHLGVAGSSIGGFIASGILAHQEAVRCLVNLNGSPAWEVVEDIWRKRDGRPPMTDEERAALRKWDPMSHLETIAPRAILHLHGTADTSVSVEGARAFVRAAEKLYQAHPERIRFEEVSRMDHHITLGMVEALFGWFDQHL